jgi:GDPmannose 4,6-dehydratase
MRALITGVAGQDGRFLTNHLIDLGYEVYGLARRKSAPCQVLDSLSANSKGRFKVLWGDVTDYSSVLAALRESRPDEIYNLAAQSHVGASFSLPVYTSDVNAGGVLHILDGVRTACPDARIYQASTSELFGKTRPPQSECSIMHPRSPYGVAKLHGFWSIVNHRESYGMHASNGILFNHESEIRGVDFVTRKITLAAARIKTGKQERLHLGNLDAKRDWGYAGDYVKAMHMILQHPTPDDYVVATGEARTVREFLEIAFAVAGIGIESNGLSGADEVYLSSESGQPMVVVDREFYRPAEVDYLCGDPSKIKRILGWKPSTSFPEMVEKMVAHDLDAEGGRI